MSKRAEEAAMKAYPDDSFVSDEYADMCRSFYQEGYELAEKDTIELAIEWWRPRLRKMTSPGLTEGILEEFRNGMKER